MESQASRAKARVNVLGESILLLDQDRAQWDRLLIGRGLAALARAQQLGGERGPYAIQAAIAACHPRAVTAAATDWERIVALYVELRAIEPSPVVELNRAVAMAMASGPEAGLELVDALRDAPALRGYHLLPSVRGDLLKKLGRNDEARVEFEMAASMTRNALRKKSSAEPCAELCLGARFRGHLEVDKQLGSDSTCKKTLDLSRDLQRAERSQSTVRRLSMTRCPPICTSALDRAGNGISITFKRGTRTGTSDFVFESCPEWIQSNQC